MEPAILENGFLKSPTVGIIAAPAGIERRTISRLNSVLRQPLDALVHENFQTALSVGSGDSRYTAVNPSGLVATRCAN
jgi:hypothetical protein